MTVNNKLSFIFLSVSISVDCNLLAGHNSDKSFSNCRIELEIVDILLLNH